MKRVGSVPLTKAEISARHRERTKERLAEVERLKERIAVLETALDEAVAERVAHLSPDDLLRAFRKMSADRQGVFLGGLWRIIAEKVKGWQP